MIQIDMGMPKSCLTCRLAYVEDLQEDWYKCTVCGKDCYQEDISDDYGRTYHRPHWCPLKEVIYGHWIGVGDQPYEEYECSVCGQDPCDLGDIPTWKYCPDCGTRMDK